MKTLTAGREGRKDGPEVIEEDAFTSHRVIECNELLFTEQCAGRAG